LFLLLNVLIEQASDFLDVWFTIFCNGYIPEGNGVPYLHNTTFCGIICFMTNLLSPELSQENPEFYKERLLTVLGRASTSGLVALEKARIDVPAMVLNPLGYRSVAYDNGLVHLGTGLMNRDMRNRLLFDEENFGPDEEVAYRLLHETAHTLYEDVLPTPEGKALVKLVRGHRTMRHLNRGLTALGSLDHFENPFSKFREDATELMAMYYWGPKFLATYADYLANPAQIEKRDARGQVAITTPDAFLGVISIASEAAIS
jgi:hypothetical protein